MKQQSLLSWNKKQEGYMEVKVTDVQITIICDKQHDETKRNSTIKAQKIEWDIWDYIFLNFCDYDSIVTTRMLQSKYVKHSTENKDFELAIKGSNLM